MEPTYTMLGADGKQYGPVTIEKFRTWIGEGRVGGDTQVWRSDQPAWASAATLPELGLATAAPAPLPSSPPAPFAPAANDPALAQRMKSGAGWFYWIAGFSVVNTICVLTNQTWGFALGLAATAYLDREASATGTGAALVPIILNVLVVTMVVLFGFFAGKGHTWAFIVGMVVLAIDTALTGLFQMWMSLALHLFALFCIFAGYRACRTLRG
jgi:hypothetical protein